MPGITVIKRDYTGREVWRYPAQVISRDDHSVQIEALFNREQDVPVGEISFRKGDRFVEWYDSRKWYTIYEVHDREDGRVKCWYCDVCRPAEITDDTISFEDLALDLLVYPDGRQAVLDEEEFVALPLGDEERRRAREALAELQRLFTGRHEGMDHFRG